MSTAHCACHLPMISHYEVQHLTEFQRIMFDEFLIRNPITGYLLPYQPMFIFSLSCVFLLSISELPTQKKPTSVMDEPYFSNFTTISVITSKMQEHTSAT